MLWPRCDVRSLEEEEPSVRVERPHRDPRGRADRVHACRQQDPHVLTAAQVEARGFVHNGIHWPLHALQGRHDAIAGQHVDISGLLEREGEGLAHGLAEVTRRVGRVSDEDPVAWMERGGLWLLDRHDPQRSHDGGADGHENRHVLAEGAEAVGLAGVGAGSAELAEVDGKVLGALISKFG